VNRTKILAALGRVGFFAKACVYAGIGVLACASAVSAPQNESPQGVFLLIGSQRGVWGQILLAVMFLGLGCYICWRFWEGLSGQGSAPHVSAARNFFKYRLSPLVSGAVYVAYAAYVAALLIAPLVHRGATHGASCFPSCWRESTAGSLALSLAVLAFAIGAITQLLPAIDASFEQEMDRAKLARLPAFVRSLVLWAGRVGFFSRAALFALVSFYFARIVVGADVAADPKQNTVAQALNEQRVDPPGLLFAVGVGLVVYGVFALANVFLRAFPTPAPAAASKRATPAR
jgi:hypothetical protein